MTGPRRPYTERTSKNTNGHDRIMLKFLDGSWRDEFISRCYGKSEQYAVFRQCVSPYFEHPIKNDGGFGKKTIGYADVYLPHEQIISRSECSSGIYVELKSHDDVSVGELLRKLRYYEDAVESGMGAWVVLVIGELPLRDVLLHSWVRVVEMTEDLSSYEVFLPKR